MLAIRSRKLSIYISLLITTVIVSIVGLEWSKSAEDSTNLAYNAENLIRLHVIANSDSPEDQAIKVGVRNSVLDVTGNLLKNAASVEEALTILKDNLEYLRTKTVEQLSAVGKEYPVTVKLGEYPFPTKAYGNFVLAAGTYPAVRVEIGAADGHNWWCVLFPPLCFLNMSGPLAAERIQQVTVPQVAGSQKTKPRITVDLSNPFDLPMKPIPVVTPPLPVD